MKLPQVENGVGPGAAPRPGRPSTRTWPLLAPVPMNRLSGDGRVHVVLTSVEPTGAPEGVSVTHPLEVALEHPLAPATVQLQTLTVCCGRVAVSAAPAGPAVAGQF